MLLVYAVSTLRESLFAIDVFDVTQRTDRIFLTRKIC